MDKAHGFLGHFAIGYNRAQEGNLFSIKKVFHVLTHKAVHGIAFWVGFTELLPAGV
jgi:hypothetical protein